MVIDPVPRCGAVLRSCRICESFAQSGIAAIRRVGEFPRLAGGVGYPTGELGKMPGLSFCKEFWLKHEKGLGRRPLGSASGSLEMLYRKIYVSNAATPCMEPDINALLEVSRKNNRRAGLTGLLIFYQGRFFQVLEGKQASLAACYSRILKDPRHKDIIEIFDGPIEGCAFPNWRMGFSRPDSLGSHLRDSILSVYSLVPPNSEDRGADPRVRKEVRNFLAGFQYVPKSRA